MLKQLMIAVVTVLALAGVSEAKSKFSGKWGGVSSSTLTFMDNNQVRYCFKAQCVVRRYFGSPDQSISFTWGSARLKFQRTKSGYSGTHNVGGQVSKINMR